MIKFLKNIWFFRKELYNYRNWHYGYSTEIFLRSLEGLKRGIKSRQNHTLWEEDYQNISKTIRVIKRYHEESFCFDLAKRIIGGEPEPTIEKNEDGQSIFEFKNKELANKYYDEVNRIQGILRERSIKLLLENYEKWWD